MHGIDPAAKIFGDELVGRTILRVDLQRQPSERAAILSIRDQNALAITFKDGEDALNRIGGRRICGFDDHGMERAKIAFKDFAKQRFFAVKEVVEAA